jgi:hypothetical protein
MDSSFINDLKDEIEHLHDELYRMTQVSLEQDEEIRRLNEQLTAVRLERDALVSQLDLLKRPKKPKAKIESELETYKKDVEEYIALERDLRTRIVSMEREVEKMRRTTGYVYEGNKTLIMEMTQRLAVDKEEYERVKGLLTKAKGRVTKTTNLLKKF